MKFRKKPVVIDAMQLTREAFENVVVWVDENGHLYHYDKAECIIQIGTLEGLMAAREGAWIIKGVAGEMYPCADVIFKATYEPAE